MYFSFKMFISDIKYFQAFIFPCLALGYGTIHKIHRSEYYQTAFRLFHCKVPSVFSFIQPLYEVILAFIWVICGLYPLLLITQNIQNNYCMFKRKCKPDESYLSLFELHRQLYISGFSLTEEKRADHPQFPISLPFLEADLPRSNLPGSYFCHN